ncbi:XdhC family protein [Kineococcus sp. SYSU DK006]|uniref:XdhC family protein n=1 Tax=Kineococcus sp. SYSU DK006 TaxID=3383127 RepID=UPI003D7C7CD1
MRDVLEQVARWTGSGRAVAVATVVRTWRSAPRQPGASLAVDADGEVVGSVSGGCVEGAVYELARQVLADGVPVLTRYGVSDDDAFAVGLTCGGELDVFVRRLDGSGGDAAQVRALAAAVRERRPVAAATVVAGPAELRGRTLLVHPGGREGTLGSARLDDAVTDDARGLLETGTTACLHLGADGQRRHDELEVFVESFAPPPRLVVFGAIDFAAALTRVGAFLGFHVTVCDARPVFATPRRFPDADEVVVEWPHRYLARTEVDERTVLCVLTHDPKFDVPLLELALRGPAAYVGAMGSRRTHEDRLARLREAGLGEEQLARLSSPIGLDLGARTPEETTVSIAAEITAARWGGSGKPLRRTAGRIHHEGGGGTVGGRR